MMRRLAAYAALAICALLAAYVALISLGSHRYCLGEKARCITVTYAWIKVPMLTGRSTMILQDRGLLKRDLVNEMDLWWLTSEEDRNIAELTGSEPRIPYSFGTVSRVRDSQFKAQNLKVPGFFENAVYVRDHALVIRCRKLDCLEAISSIE